MNVNLRNGRPQDADVLGRICFEAFAAIADRHNFPRDFPNVEIATGLMRMLLGRGDVFSVVAEVDGQTVGSNFLWEGSDVSGVGPITIDPGSQNGSVGKKLMEAVVERSDTRGFSSIRLVQAAYHNRSLALYTKLGFDSVEPLSVMQGAPVRRSIEGRRVRPMTEEDLPEVNALCRRVHGIVRSTDALDGIAQGTARVVVSDGRITGYASSLGFFGHAVGESNDDLKALIGSADEFSGPGILVPTRNSDLMRWCLKNGLQIVMPMTLMTRGIYQEPRGAFLPSILF
ncbi:MAG: GNAT family N-acetyltransferase [Pyrinomonadaceae bacterium]